MSHFVVSARAVLGMGLSLVLALSGCGGGDSDVVAGGPTLACPSGASTWRVAYTTGYALWCKRADGVEHGPFEQRDREDGVLIAGGFANGLADGVWHRFGPGPDYAPTADEAYADGKPHAHWATYDADGEPTSDHTWAYGVPCGTWRELEGGVEVSRADYVDCDKVDEPEPVIGPPRALVGDFGWDGQTCDAGTLVSDVADDPGAHYCTDGTTKQGPFGRWITDGKVETGGSGAVVKVEGGTYTEGLATGVWRTWYTNGTVHEEGTRSADARTGTWRTWRADRTLDSEVVWVDDEREGSATGYWPHGTKAFEGAYEADAEHGTWKTYYPSGVPDEVVTWKLGARDGAYTKNHESGVHAIEGAYAADQRSGTWKTWHDNGVAANEGRYDGGVPVGVWKTWNRDGTSESEGPYVDGQPHGTWSFWHWQNGERVKATGLVERGVLQGAWHAVHDPGGGPAGDVIYSNGVREGASTTIWKNGQLASEGSYHAGVLTGRWKFYYESGQVFLDCGFLLGVYDGAYSEYWENGQLKAQGTYQAGAKLEDWRYWTEDGRPTNGGGS